MMKKYCIVFVSLLLLIMAMPLQAFAMESVTAEIPFVVENIPGTVVIEAVGDEPLPEVTEMPGVSHGTFEVVYTEPGNYYYKVYQIPGEHEGIIYNDYIYNVLVSVFVDENGSLYTAVTLGIDGKPHKPEKAEFPNEVDGSAEAKPITDGSSSESSHDSDDSSNDSFGDTLTDADAENVSSDTDADLDNNTNSSSNSNVSGGASGTPNGGNSIFGSNANINTGAIQAWLLQSGWLFIMIGIGIMFIIVGVVRSRKEREEPEQEVP